MTLHLKANSQAKGSRLRVAAYLAIAVATVAAAGCGWPVAQASFRLRPDTTHWGSLLGPFEGQVVDQATGNPVSGALVIGTWAFEAEQGPAIPSSSYTTNMQTNSDGSYSLPALPATEHPQTLLRRFTLVVYKAGYLGYRSDLRSDDHTPRRDFAQLANKIRLDRFPAGESRAAHLLFLGGGQQVLRAAQAEVIQAALELGDRLAATAPALPTAKEGDAVPAPETTKAAPRTTPLSLAEQLLSQEDVGQAKNPELKSVYRAEPIAAEALTSADLAVPEYSGVHYRAKDSAESFDAALRVYRLASGAEADALWKRLRTQLQTTSLRPTATPVNLVVPPQRAAQPLVRDVPSTAPPLRDGGGAAHAFLPTSPVAAATTPSKPLHIDGSLSVHDAQRRVYGVALVIRQLGLVIELICGADLCVSEDAAGKLLMRSLTRL